MAVKDITDVPFNKLRFERFGDGVQHDPQATVGTVMGVVEGADDVAVAASCIPAQESL